MELLLDVPQLLRCKSLVFRPGDVVSRPFSHLIGGGQVRNGLKVDPGLLCSIAVATSLEGTHTHGNKLIEEIERERDTEKVEYGKEDGIIFLHRSRWETS